MSLRNISLLLQSTQIAIQCHFRAEEVNDEFEKGEVVTQSINEVERHEAGHQDAVQTSSVRKSRSWWHDVISSKKVEFGFPLLRMPPKLNCSSFTPLITMYLCFVPLSCRLQMQ